MGGWLWLRAGAGWREWKRLTSIKVDTSAIIHLCCGPPPLFCCRYLLELMKKDIKPRDIMTMAAFENAMTVVMATGGSTNAGKRVPRQEGWWGL